MGVFKVSARSNPKAVAGALAAAIRQEGQMEIEVIGAGALNQAVKAIAIARGYVAPNGLNLAMYPVFEEKEIGGQVKTALKLYVICR